MMLINPYLIVPEINWTVTSAYSYTKTDGANRSMLLNAPVSTSGAGETWITAFESHSYTGSSSIRFNFTANNTISINLLNNGITHRIRARCYDSANNLLGYVGFNYVFNASGTTTGSVNIARDFGSYSESTQNVGLNVLTFNAADVFELFVNTTTREWEVTNGAYKADGDTLLGLIPSNTAYVLYGEEIYVGAHLTGVAETNVLSVS